MTNRNQAHYQEAQITMKNLHQYLITHAVSIKGRLSPPEEDTLANIFHAQINLQALLADILIENGSSLEKAHTSDLDGCQETLIQELRDIFSQLTLYAKLLSRVTADQEEGEAVKYASQIVSIVNGVQARLDQFLESSGQKPTKQPQYQND